MENYFECFDELRDLTEELVSIRSVVGSEGCEQSIAEFIRDYMSEWDYLKKHPENLFLVPTENDSLKRSSVIAIVEPSSSEKHINDSTEAVMLMGHIDTVETSDYGRLEPLATNPRELQYALREICEEPVLTDIDSGRYMFGRGALDMKAGVASCLYILKHFSENRDELNGALIALFECDEEGDSHGALTSMSFINDRLKERNINIKAGMCADYSSKEAAVYLGTIGKYLPCVMAFGISSHVGQAFDSLDPNLIISEIISEIDYNTDYCEESFGEITLPPVTLKQSDTKTTYSVQTVSSSYVYFNWFSLKRTEEEILELVKKEAEKAVRKALDRISHAKNNYMNINEAVSENSFERTEDTIIPQVMTLKEYARAVGTEIRDVDRTKDIREFWISEAVRIHNLDHELKPVVLVFTAGVNYPPITVDPDSEIGIAAAQLGIPVRMYYPFISDASFVNLLGNVPLVNLGTYGKDAHMYTERVEMQYSLEKLPNLTWKLILKLLN